VIARLLLLSCCLAALPGAEQDADADADAQRPAAELAVFRIEQAPSERPQGPAAMLGGDDGSLRRLVERIEQAAADPGIAGAVLLAPGVETLSVAQIEALRSALDHFRAGGKRVWAHAEELGWNGYLLLSAADQLALAPGGSCWITGLHAESPYLGELLDELGVQADLIAVGDYKSAIEHFTRQGPSEAAERMQDWLLDDLFARCVALLATGRGVQPQAVRDWIDGAPQHAEQALDGGLIDLVLDRGAFIEHLREHYGALRLRHGYGREHGPQVDWSSPFAVFGLLNRMVQGQQNEAGGPSIAILHIDGTIMPGEERPTLFGGSGNAHAETIRRACEALADDPQVRGVVLRINSPGGSASASDSMLAALRRLSARKPMVVSLATVAASGGYYVACTGDRIYAQPSTLTASIGVFGGKLVTNKLWQRIGVHWHAESRGRNAGLLSSGRAFDDEQRQVLRQHMQQTYATFTGHVLRARGAALQQPIEELAAGRVFTGRQAAELGLVDELGGLSDALAWLSAEIQLDDYQLRIAPRPSNPFAALMGAGGRRLGPEQLAVGRLRALLLQAVAALDPQRRAAVARLAASLELMHGEGVLLRAPEVVFRP